MESIGLGSALGALQILYHEEEALYFDDKLAENLPQCIARTFATRFKTVALRVSLVRQTGRSLIENLRRGNSVREIELVVGPRTHGVGKYHVEQDEP